MRCLNWVQGGLIAIYITQIWWPTFNTLWFSQFQYTRTVINKIWCKFPVRRTWLCSQIYIIECSDWRRFRLLCTFKYFKLTTGRHWYGSISTLKGSTTQCIKPPSSQLVLFSNHRFRSRNITHHGQTPKWLPGGTPCGYFTPTSTNAFILQYFHTASRSVYVSYRDLWLHYYLCNTP